MITAVVGPCKLGAVKARSSPEKYPVDVSTMNCPVRFVAAVFDVAVSYRNHNQNKAKGVADTNDYSQTDLEERFDRVRKKDEG